MTFRKKVIAGSKTSSISPKALNSSRYFVVQPARQSRSARGRSSYRKESTYSHMQVNLRVYSELFSALLNIFASTPSRNRTYNCPLGGGCYIHLTTESNVYSENGVYLKKRKPAKQQENAVSRYNISIIHRFRKKSKYFYAVFLRKGFSNCCKIGKKVV